MTNIVDYERMNTICADPSHIVCRLKPTVVWTLLNNAGTKWTEHDNRIRIYSAWKWLELKNGMKLGTLYMHWLNKVKPDRDKPDSYYIEHYLATDSKCIFYTVMKELNEEQEQYKLLKPNMIHNPKFDAYIDRMRELEAYNRETSIKEAIKRFCDPFDTDYLNDDNWYKGVVEIIYKPNWTFEELASYLFSRVTIASYQGKSVVVVKGSDGTYDIQHKRSHVITSNCIPQLRVRSGNITYISCLDYFRPYSHLYTVNIVMQNPWVELPPKTINIMPMPRIYEPDMECSWYDEYKNAIISHLKDYYLIMEDNKDYWIDVLLSWMSAVIFDYKPTKRMLIFSGPREMDKSAIFHALQQILPKVTYEEPVIGLEYCEPTTFTTNLELKKLLLINEDKWGLKANPKDMTRLERRVMANTLIKNERYRKLTTIDSIINIALITSNSTITSMNYHNIHAFIHFNIPIVPNKDKSNQFDKLLMEYPKLLLRLLLEYKGRWFEQHYDTTVFNTNAMMTLSNTNIILNKNAFINRLCEALIKYTSEIAYIKHHSPTVDITLLETRTIKGEKYILIDKSSYSKLDMRYMCRIHRKWGKKLISAFRDVGITRKSIRNARSFDGTLYIESHGFYAIPYSILKNYYDDVYVSKSDDDV